MNKCSSCSYENPNDSNFCENCGFKLETKLNIDSNPTRVPVKIEDLCIICKSSHLTQEIKKENLGLNTGIYFVWHNCKTRFKVSSTKDGAIDKLRLVATTYKDNIIWKKYKNLALFEIEWINISNGGISDVEEETGKLEEKIEAENQKQLQINLANNKFLTELEQGKDNISTSSSQSPVI